MAELVRSFMSRLSPKLLIRCQRLDPDSFISVLRIVPQLQAWFRAERSSYPSPGGCCCPRHPLVSPQGCWEKLRSPSDLGFPVAAVTGSHSSSCRQLPCLRGTRVLGEAAHARPKLLLSWAGWAVTAWLNCIQTHPDGATG